MQSLIRAVEPILGTCCLRAGGYSAGLSGYEPIAFASVTSLYLNIGFLDPLDMCRRAETEYREGRAPLNAVEGLIRQIIGWREYVRGVYWLKMP